MSEKTTHPLAKNPLWVFKKPSLGFDANLALVEEKGGKRSICHLSTSDTCRETAIHSVRGVLQARISQEIGRNWEEKGRTITHDVDLEDSLPKNKPVSLSILWGHDSYTDSWPEGKDFPIEKFFGVCYRVLGPVCVLLGPWRPRGDSWWRTDPKKDLHPRGGSVHNFAYWNGSDNWFLAHPVTMAIALGLYRQCYHLCGAGVADQIIKNTSEEEVEELMSEGDVRVALRLAKRNRLWIEVPVGTGGGRQHYPFAQGLWKRLIRLQRAIRRHGYEESLNQSFVEGWSITGVGTTSWNGLYGYWGDSDSLTDAHRHLMQKGAPRRKSDGEKRATQSAG